MNCLVANNSQPNFSLREWNERMTGISFENEIRDYIGLLYVD